MREFAKTHTTPTANRQQFRAYAQFDWVCLLHFGDGPEVNRWMVAQRKAGATKNGYSRIPQEVKQA